MRNSSLNRNSRFNNQSMNNTKKMNSTLTSMYSGSTRPNTANKSITDIIKKADQKLDNLYKSSNIDLKKSTVNIYDLPNKEDELFNQLNVKAKSSPLTKEEQDVLDILKNKADFKRITPDQERLILKKLNTKKNDRPGTTTSLYREPNKDDEYWKTFDKKMKNFNFYNNSKYIEIIESIESYNFRNKSKLTGDGSTRVDPYENIVITRLNTMVSEMHRVFDKEKQEKCLDNVYE